MNYEVKLERLNPLLPITGLIAITIIIVFLIHHYWYVKVEAYPIALTHVERKYNNESFNGASSFVDGEYADEICKIGFNLNKSDYSLLVFSKISNLSDYALEILWNEVLSIYMNRYYHVEFSRYIDRQRINKWPRTIIKLGETLVQDKLPFIGIDQSDLIIQDFLAADKKITPEAGKFYLLVPLRVQGSMYKYIFEFKIRGSHSRWRFI